MKGNNSGGPKQPYPVPTGKIKEKQPDAEKEATTTSSDDTPKKELSEDEKRIAEIEKLLKRPWHERSHAEIEAAETFLEQGMSPESRTVYDKCRQTVNDFCSNVDTLCQMVERKTH